MVEVRELFPGRVDLRTQLWVADCCLEAIDNLDDMTQRVLLKKLEHFCRAGFDVFEGASRPIRSEGDGVFRIGIQRSLFRLLGFYERRPDVFISPDAFKKRGQQLSSADRKRIKAVARVKDKDSYRKVE